MDPGDLIHHHYIQPQKNSPPWARMRAIREGEPADELAQMKSMEAEKIIGTRWAR